MSWSVSCPSVVFRQSQDQWTLTYVCVTSPGVPRGTGMVEGLV